MLLLKSIIKSHDSIDSQENIKSKDQTPLRKALLSLGTKVKK